MIAVNHRQLLVSVATQRGISGGGGGLLVCVLDISDKQSLSSWHVSLQVSHLLSCRLQRRRRI